MLPNKHKANLASKNDIANFVNKTDSDDKLIKFKWKNYINKTKHLLVENYLKKPQTFDSSLFIGQSYINNDGAQLYLIFQPIYKTITTFYDLPDIISEWECKGLSNEKIKPPFTAIKSLSPKLVWMNNFEIR